MRGEEGRHRYWGGQKADGYEVINGFDSVPQCNVEKTLIIKLQMFNQ